MSQSLRRFGTVLPVVGIALALAASNPAAPGSTPAEAAPNYRLSGPYTHENLTIYLIHGEDKVKDKNFLTLQEALAAKKVIVHETQNVNQLSIENTSADEVFVQSGDIVKGGQQDRVIAYDLIVPAHSGKMPLASFCVEAGRWTQRGHENATQFEISGEQAPTKELKIAVRSEKKQMEVWKNVAKAQDQLGANLGGGSLRGGESASSLQLTLESDKLKQATDAYVKKLASIIDGKDDVLGYAVAVNGKISSADIYISHGLFQKVWPVLLKGSAVEAIAGLQKDKKFTPPALQDVEKFLADTAQGKASSQEITKRVRLIQRETGKAILFETRDASQKAMPALRQSLISK
jgi:hypothetical protein